MTRVELTEQESEPDVSVRISCGNAPPAWWFALQLACRAFRLGQVACNALAVREIDVAGLGQPELAGGAVQQLGAQPLFEFMHVAADRGLGQARRACCGCEAAQLDRGLIRFARVDAGSTVIDVYPGDGDWTCIFSGVAGPRARLQLVPAEVAHLDSFPVGRMRALAKATLSKVLGGRWAQEPVHDVGIHQPQLPVAECLGQGAYDGEPHLLVQLNRGR